jgi:hypothetical protein
MLRARRSHTEYGWIIGDRLTAMWPNADDPPAGWTRIVAGSGTITRICDGTETDHPHVISYSYSALSQADRDAAHSHQGKPGRNGMSRQV